MGVRVVPLPDEREAIEALASDLGVRFPFDGPALRLVFGSCVFHDDGCRLHRTYGSDAKPRVCQQFPWVRRGEAMGVDPACAHWTHSSSPPTEPMLGTDAGGRAPLTGEDLAGLAEALGVGLDEVAGAWRSAPWSFWVDQGAAGPLRRSTAADLAMLTPPEGWPSWPAGARAVKEAWRLGLTDDPCMALVGAVVVAAGLQEEKDRRRAFAVWLRGLRG